MSVIPTDTHPDPRSIADDLRQRLIDEGWPEENITTDITIWADGDCRVVVWHSIDTEEDNPTEKIKYIQHPDGTIEREHLELGRREIWEVADRRTIE